MKELMMMKGARKIVRECVNVKPGEEVVIVTDFLAGKAPSMLAMAAFEITPHVTLVYIPTRQRDGQDPTRCAAEAMKTADVIFIPTTVSITHSTATREAIKAGARGQMRILDDMLIKGGIDADFLKIRPLVQWVGKCWTEGKIAKITTPGGTNLVANIEGRGANVHAGIAHEPGTLTSLPSIETSVSPNEGTAEGTIVFDASIPYFDIGILKEPVKYYVEKGKVVKIEGGVTARRVRDMMAACNDENVYNIAQLSIGLNPCCRIIGKSSEDEGVYRTFHIGIGTSSNLGGTTKAAMHYDGLMWNPTLEIDGKVISLNGELQHPDAAEILK